MNNITDSQLFWILTEKTNFLQPFQLPNSEILVYVNSAVDTEHLKKEGINIGLTELCSMLLILYANNYMLPITFKNINLINTKEADNTPFFILTDDIHLIPSSIEFEIFDMEEASKIFMN